MRTRISPRTVDENGNTELSEGALREIMYRTAGTPFRCSEVRVQVPEGEK